LPSAQEIIGLPVQSMPQSQTQ